METKYGIIADIEEDPRIVPIAVNVLKSLGAERLIVNGDIGRKLPRLEESQHLIAAILDAVGRSGLESFVQPGSHETVLAYNPVIKALARKHTNIIDAVENKKIEHRGHNLVFLPGSDWLAGGEYQLADYDSVKTGMYMVADEGSVIPFENLQQFAFLFNQGLVKGLLHYQNMNDLRTLVTDPAKTVLICHIPRKFNNLEQAVDVAQFGEVQQPCSVGIIQYEDGEVQLHAYKDRNERRMITKPKQIRTQSVQEFEIGTVMPAFVAEPYIKAGVPIAIKKENRGNETLKSLYKKLGIRKAVSGHFHESSHRAHDCEGNQIPQDTFVNELFWNSGSLDIGQMGLLTVDEDKVSYKNVRLEDHLR